MHLLVPKTQFGHFWLLEGSRGRRVSILLFSRNHPKLFMNTAHINAWIVTAQCQSYFFLRLCKIVIFNQWTFLYLFKMKTFFFDEYIFITTFSRMLVYSCHLCRNWDKSFESQVFGRPTNFYFCGQWWSHV